VTTELGTGDAGVRARARDEAFDLAVDDTTIKVHMLLLDARRDLAVLFPPDPDRQPACLLGFDGVIRYCLKRSMTLPSQPSARLRLNSASRLIKTAPRRGGAGSDRGALVERGHRAALHRGGDGRRARAKRTLRVLT
jgi:hypothetical protein